MSYIPQKRERSEDVIDMISKTSKSLTEEIIEEGVTAIPKSYSYHRFTGTITWMYIECVKENVSSVADFEELIQKKQRKAEYFRDENFDHPSAIPDDWVEDAYELVEKLKNLLPNVKEFFKE